MTFTLTTEQEIIDKCGVYADTDLTGSTALLRRYCTQAEGKVCGETKVNWLESLPDTSFGLAIISDCVSDVVAGKIIKDNIFTYKSVEEAQTMLDFLDNNYRDNIKILKDMDVKKKMGAP